MPVSRRTAGPTRDRSARPPSTTRGPTAGSRPLMQGVIAQSTTTSAVPRRTGADAVEIVTGFPAAISEGLVLSVTVTRVAAVEANLSRVRSTAIEPPSRACTGTQRGHVSEDGGNPDQGAVTAQERRDTGRLQPLAPGQPVAARQQLPLRRNREIVRIVTSPYRATFEELKTATLAMADATTAHFPSVNPYAARTAVPKGPRARRRTCHPGSISHRVHRARSSPRLHSCLFRRRLRTAAPRQTHAP